MHIKKLKKRIIIFLNGKLLADTATNSVDTDEMPPGAAPFDQGLDWDKTFF